MYRRLSWEAESSLLPSRTRMINVAFHGMQERDWKALEREVVDLFTALRRVERAAVRRRGQGRLRVGLRRHRYEEPGGGRGRGAGAPQALGRRLRRDHQVRGHG